MMRNLRLFTLASLLLGSGSTLLAAAEKKAPALTVHSHTGTIYPLMVPALLGIILMLLLYIRQLQQEIKKKPE